MNLVEISQPNCPVVKKDENPLKVESGITQGYYEDTEDDDARYFEKLTTHQGKVIWFELIY